MQRAFNTRNGLLAGMVMLLGMSLAGCEGGELAPNDDDRPRVLAVHFVSDGEEAENDVTGTNLAIIRSVSGPQGACLSGAQGIVPKDVQAAIYISVPNTQEELDIDIFLGKTNQTGGAPADPATVSAVGRPTVVYNQPGSARGVVRAVATISFATIGNFGGASYCGGSNVTYEYNLQAVVLDTDFRGDAVTYPLGFIDDTSNQCKSSASLCRP